MMYSYLHIFLVTYFIDPFALVGSESKEELTWAITVVKHLKERDLRGFADVVDVTCSLKDCYSNYYARIRVLHTYDANGNDDFISIIPGMSPRALITVRYQLKEELHITDALIVESDNCLCLQNITFEWISSNTHADTCLMGTASCEKVFLIPLPVTDGSLSFQITIESAETGFYIPRKSVRVYNIKHNYTEHGIFNFDVDNFPSSLTTNLTKLKKVQDEVKIWTLLIGDYVILSSNEMESQRVAKFSLASGFAEICSAWESDAKDVLSLPDRFLVASKFGFIEYMIFEGVYLPPKVLLEICITTIETISQAAETGFYVMAVSNDSSTFYIGQYYQGVSLDMKKAIDSTNRSICQAIANSIEGCRVLAFASSYTKVHSVHILVETSHQLLVEYSLNSSSFVVLQNLSFDRLHHKPAMIASKELMTYNFVGLSFTQLYADYLFIWGNLLVYSPNAGQKIIKMIDLGDDVINLFATSHRGYFAFITDLKKIYFGKIGTSSLKQLASLDADQTLTIFFDSAGDLYQLSMLQANCNLSSCIEKTKVPLREALAFENTHTKLINSQRCCSNYQNVKCQESTLSCSFDRTKSRNIERTCPFAKITLESYNFQFFSRVALVLHCRDRVNSLYVTKMSEVSNSLFWTEWIKAESSAMDNCLWEDPSHDAYRLPRSISLGRGICYNFTIEVFLDHSDFADFYSHRFELEGIRLSVTDPKPEHLLISFKRTINYEEDSVKFQVTLSDSGKKRKQNPPGTGHEVISPEIKVVGSGLNCISNSYQDDGDIQGYFTTKVLLGCPAGQKVVFDSVATKKRGAVHYCDQDLSDVPCFHFDRVFSPVFNLVDEATRKVEIFSGKYSLVIVKGGRKLDQLHDFSESEQVRYNFEAGSSLIWAPSKRYDGKPIFTKDTSSFSWLCSSSSPCSGIAPTFPNPPIYYFVIEFSNRDIDNSNCDFTFHFTIKVEGIAPGSINPSLIIVLVSIGLMIIGLLVGYFVRKRYSHIIANFQWTVTFAWAIKSTKIESGEEDKSVNSDREVAETHSKTN